MGDAAGVGNARRMAPRREFPGFALAIPTRLALLDERADAFGGILAQHVPRDRAARRGVRLRKPGLDLLVEERFPGRALRSGLLDDGGGESLYLGVELGR